MFIQGIKNKVEEEAAQHPLNMHDIQTWQDLKEVLVNTYCDKRAYPT